MKLSQRQPPITIPIDLSKLVKQIVEVHHILQQQTELTAPNEAIAALVSSLVRTHQCRLAVECWVQLYDTLVDLCQRQTTVAIVVHSVEEFRPLLFGWHLDLFLFGLHSFLLPLGFDLPRSLRLAATLIIILILIIASLLLCCGRGCIGH